MPLSKPLLKLWSIGLILIFIFYAWLDRPISTFIYLHHFREHLVLIKQIIEWPPIIEALSPIIFFILLVFNYHKPHPSRFQNMLILLTLSVMLTYLLKNDLKWIFSRYWPETFTHNNLSWINNQAYGFQWFQGRPFQGSDITGSFPSGHSSIAFAMFSAIGFYYRKFFIVSLLLASLEALSMVLFDYHFVSDVIAGACLGITCSFLCFKLLETLRTQDKI